MALTLSVGFVVDDAIVMLENIVRHMEMGEAPMQAALTGSREIGFTILSMTLSLAAVFIPVLFMGGIARPAVARVRGDHRRRHSGVRLRLAHPHADAVQPLPAPPQKPGTIALYRSSERVFQGMLHGYDWSLKKAIRHRLCHAASSRSSCWSSPVICSSSSPRVPAHRRHGQIFTMVEADAGHFVREHGRLTKLALAEIVAQESLRRKIHVRHRRLGRRQQRTHVRPPEARAIVAPPAQEIVALLRRDFLRFRASRVYPQVRRPSSIGGQLSKRHYQFTLQGPDTAGALPRARKRSKPSCARLPEYRM